MGLCACVCERERERESLFLRILITLYIQLSKLNSLQSRQQHIFHLTQQNHNTLHPAIFDHSLIHNIIHVLLIAKGKTVKGESQ